MRSALPFKSLFLFLLSVSSVFAADRSDRFLFRVVDQVVGLQDLRLTDADLSALQCHFSDSLLIEYVGPGFISQLHEVIPQLETLKTPLREKLPLVIFLSSVRQGWKLLSYIDGQEVQITSELEKGLLKPSKCPRVQGERQKLRASFRRWLRVEIYLRSRYAQGGISNDKGKIEKRFQSINLFVDSLDKQLVHEDFW